MQDEATTIEEWRPVPGYVGIYEVSDQGRVRSLDRVVWEQRRAGSRFTNRKGRILRYVSGPYGHRTVELNRNGARRCGIHRLMLLAFVGPCPAGMVCRHIDGDPVNNSLANLRWGTHQENADDCIQHGRRPRGSGHPNARLSAADVMDIRTRIPHTSSTALAAEYGVARSTIKDVASGRSWAHLPGASPGCWRKK